MPIGNEQTISAPHMHAACLDLLADQLQPGASALDVGSGSGCGLPICALPRPACILRLWHHKQRAAAAVLGIFLQVSGPLVMCTRPRPSSPSSVLHRYLTAVMGRLVSPGGHVMGVEKWPDLAERSVNNIRVRGQACACM